MARARKARVVKSAEDRQDEILDVAERLFTERGYSDTSVQAILDTVGIAKGTFYHHFPSKTAVLEAVVDRLRAKIPHIVLPVVEDPDLDATTKFVALFERVNQWKLGQGPLMIEVGRALQGPQCAELQERHRQASTEVIVPLLARVIGQGNDEGVFGTDSPQQSAAIVLAVLESQSRAILAAIVDDDDKVAARAAVEAAVQAHGEAVERILGAAAGTLRIIDRDTIAVWFEAASWRTP